MSPAVRPNRSADSVRHAVNARIRNAIGLTQDPIPMCNDPAQSYFPIDAVARLVHGDLSTMIIGGLGSLFLQMLHPLAMAGVAQHSRYQDDVTGRLLQTANFIGHTTYGTKSQALLDIERVRAVHEGVVGISDDGRPYAANDPHLLLWVHVCEALMFLDAYRVYGTQSLSASSLDQYVSEMAYLARDLGIATPPTTYRELHDCLTSFRPELRLSDDGRVARDFLLAGYMQTPLQKFGHRRFAAASLNLLPQWAHELLALDPPTAIDRVAGTPVTKVLCRATRYFVPPATVGPQGARHGDPRLEAEDL